jgi:hypothetical protein
MACIQAKEALQSRMFLKQGGIQVGEDNFGF